MAGHNKVIKECSKGKYFDTLVRSAAMAVYGSVFFADVSHGDAGSDGESWDTALNSVTNALSKCTTNEHDLVILKGLESQTAISDRILISKAGIHLVGAGYIFGMGGAGQSVIRVPAALSTAITGKNIDPRYAAISIQADDVEIAGIKLFQGILSTRSGGQAMIGCGHASVGYQHLSVHDCILQCDQYGYEAAEPARGISLEGMMEGYIGFNKIMWGDRGIQIDPGGGAYTKYVLVEENEIIGCGKGIWVGQTMENHFRENRIFPRQTWNALGVTFVYGIRAEANSAENYFENERVWEADKTDAIYDSGTLNLFVNCYYGVTSGAQTLYT